MRKWCAIGAMGILCALPLSAQQTDKDAGKTTTEKTQVADANLGNTAELGSSLRTAPATGFADVFPTTPRLFPFPAGSPASGGEAPGRMWPKFELAGAYQYLDFKPGDPFNTYGNNGATGSFAYNATKYLGLVAEFGGYGSGGRTTPGNSTSGSFISYLFGPRLNLRHFDHFVPFGEFLVGGMHASNGVTGGTSQDAFSLAAGGGADVVLSQHFAWRLVQLDYVMTNFSGTFLNPTARQNNFRVGTGIVFRWGFPAPPPPPNRPPVAACSANPTSVIAGSNDVVAVHVNASDPDNDTLTYTYTATGGTVEGTGPDARWNSTGLAVGTYTVNVKVDDGKGGTASCAVDISVSEKPNHPPVISCAADRSPILPGERTGITSTASDPDGDPLTYSYSTTGGQIVGSGQKVEFDSTGLQPGSYTVKCSVSDGRGGTADATANVDVQQPPPPPQAAKVGDCGYTKLGASRFDNACKRVGDDVALRLNNDPNATLVIVGYADPKEPKAEKLAATRAELAKKYIVEKGVDESRISTRVGEASKEKGEEKANRRVDFVLVPQGATY
ncbi:MAG TPA: Ig-like domain-containing protein [Terriglobales bacterium]|nr:Ig-like domain-containing protein [Terriglobales bacterium]